MAELIEDTGNITKEFHKKRIKPRHVSVYSLFPFIEFFFFFSDIIGNSWC